MPDLQEGSVTTGSPDVNVPAQNGQAGETGNQEPDYKAMHAELEEKLGKQSEELGTLREYTRAITPLMENLAEMPELARFIEAGKIDVNLAQAIVDGKVTIAEAQAATEVRENAQESVKKEVGDKEFSKMTQTELDKLVDAKLAESRKSIDQELQKIKDHEDEKEFIESARAFMKSVPDWEEHQDAVLEWLENHDIDDIRVAYYAVKGELTEKDAQKKADEKAAEDQKNVALNASGGGTSVQSLPPDSDVLDSLIAGQRNPNIF